MGKFLEPNAPASLLEGYRYFDSADIEETRRLTARQFTDHRMETIGQGGAFHAIHNAVDLGAISLNFIRYDCQSRIRVVPLSDFHLMILPINGKVQMRLRDGERVATASSAIWMPHDSAITLDWEASTSVLVCRIDREALRMVFADRLRSGEPRIPDYQQEFGTDDGAGRYLKGLVLFMVEQLDTNPWSAETPFFRQSMSQALLQGLARSPLHSLADALVGPATERPEPPVARALAFMQANLKDPITLDDIVEASGVGARTLQTAFRRSLSASPMDFFRIMRLRAARRDLSDPKRPADLSVTTVALRWGFGHVGRFASAYRLHFGEKPSDTLRR